MWGTGREELALRFEVPARHFCGFARQEQRSHVSLKMRTETRALGSFVGTEQKVLVPVKHFGSRQTEAWELPG